MSFKFSLKKIDRFLDRQTPLLLIFVLIILLRLPNFFEPYWYGDEAIYLTLGNALRHGEQLYTTIIDHKTPLIYCFAMVANQFTFRLLNLFWALLTTACFFNFATKLFKKKSLATLATLILAILSSLPWLEGNIPNGELFVMGFIMAGAVLFSRTTVFANFFKSEISFQKSQKDTILLVLSGVLMGLGILTKVPAILDVAAFLSIFWLILVSTFFDVKSDLHKFNKTFVYLLNRGGYFVLGLLLPILISIIYFVAKGRGGDYLNYGLLYNLQYSQSWSIDLGSNLLNFAFGTTGKTIILFVLFALISLNSRQLKKRFQFISLYYIFTLYSVLLSNRPYPHYFIQMVPAFSLLITDAFVSIKEIKKRKLLHSAKSLVLTALLILLTIYIMLNFNFKPYSTTKYYGQFFKYATSQINREEYENNFDSLVKDNREVSQIITTMNVKKIFIWGTNPVLYAQSHTIPTSRFTVSFHIKDFNDYDRTFTQIQKEEPKLIVVMKNESQSFPQLEEYLTQHYLANYQFDSMILYLRQE
ncbi:MAG TPA: hypothetical protein PLQ50_00170 [Candidatus Woesebacteria bacterium]|nr:hypothetical protein [Candidatus Woesebacteria bacterium]